MFYKISQFPNDSVCTRRQKKVSYSAEEGLGDKEQAIQSFSKLLCFQHAAPAKG